MKLYHFGLWFRYVECDRYNWSTTIPPYSIHIYYDGISLGDINLNFYMDIRHDKPHIIKLKKDFPKFSWYYLVGRPLTLDDFEIIENPNYKGKK
jgi:hypothetical protein